MKVLDQLKAPLRPLREAAIRFASFGRGVKRAVNGTTLRVDPRSRHSFAPSYDVGAADFLRHYVREGDEVWNVGANVGVWVLQVARWLKGTGRILALEPNPDALEILRYNVALNGALGQVEFLEVAAGEQVGTAPFFTAGPDGMARAGKPNPLLPRTDELLVRVTTLDTLASSRTTAPAWIIMDIEGWEIAALRGSSVLLKSTAFLVELHPSAWEWSGHSRRDLEALIDQHNLEVLPLSGQLDALGEHGQVLLRPRPTA